MEAVKVKKVMTVSLCVDLPVAIPNIIGYTSLRRKKVAKFHIPPHHKNIPRNITQDSNEKNLCGTVRSKKTFYMKIKKILYAKPSEMPVQAAGIGTMDLKAPSKLPGAESTRKMPYLVVVHRLDQPVEGVLVFAKTREQPET